MNQYGRDFTLAELEMIAAANSYCGPARTAALRQIAAVSGRTPEAVITKALRTRRAERDKLILERCRIEQAAMTSPLVTDTGRGPNRKSSELGV